MATFSEFVANLDADAGKRGKQFEHFVKWFLTNDPEWSTQVDQVWLWDEYPERWGIDCGIDLIFRHKNGETWAAQAKCYSHHHDITKHDVDKFLSESNRKGIDKRLLIATTDRIGTNAKQVCDAQEKTVFRYLLSNFESANIEYPATLAELNTAKRKDKPQPRGHQVEAITAVATNFRDSDRGQLIMACGTGKTFTTLWIKENLSSNSTLVLLPSLGLLSQTLHEWTLAANQPFDVLCICSDDTVGKKGGDEAIHAIADLAFPVTSDTEEIRKFLKRDGPKVVFSTYQSSPLVAEAQADASIQPFDLAIADEAHRCAGKVGSDFSMVLDSDRIRAKKRLFTTATPRTYSTNVRKAAGDRGIEVVGMDDAAVFGKVLFTLSFGEAIKRGLLTDYRVVIIGVDSPTIAQWIQNRELLKTDSGIENDAESLAAQIGLLKAFKDYDLQRVISFHSRVNRAESFTQDIQQVVGWIDAEHRPSGTLKTDFVSGAMPTDKRRRKLAQLKSLAPLERGLLANARCLSEGVDVPSLDGVAFIDPRSSQIDIIQAVGRAIRLSPNKKAGTIVLPVFIEAADSPTESIEASNFKPIWDVLNALKAHDDVLSAELDQLRIALGKNSGSKIDPDAFKKIHIDLPASVDQSFGESLRTHLVEQLTASWDFWYGLLQNYLEQHGHCLVPTAFVSHDGYRLGSWVGVQRQRSDGLSQDRKQRLDGLSGWRWNLLEHQWKTGFNHLLDYVAEHKDALVPAQYTLPDSFQLGAWVNTQRQNREELSPENVGELEALPAWSWNPRLDRWETGFRNLQDYVAMHGNSRVPSDFVRPSGFYLGRWVNMVRTGVRRLSSERRSRLEALSGWSWNQQSDDWDVGFRHLAKYVEKHGHCLVPWKLTLPNGFRLGYWVGNQKIRIDELSSKRRESLEALVGWNLNAHDEKWLVGFNHLKMYVESHGNCAVPIYFKLPNGYPLGNWVSNQRAKGKQVSDERGAMLESLKGWKWDLLDDQWELGFQNLKEYAAKHGNCSVPSKLILSNGYRLGGWVTRQRAGKGELTEWRRVALTTLTGWTWNVRDEQWETGFAYLRDYVENNGSCLVPWDFKSSTGFRLGAWVGNQKSRKETLSTERKARLASLLGWTWNVP